MDNGESITIAFNHVTVDDAGINGFMAETKTRPVSDGLTKDEGFEELTAVGDLDGSDDFVQLFDPTDPNTVDTIPNTEEAEADGLAAVKFRVITDGSAFSTAGSGMLTVSPSVVEKGTENQDLTLTYTSAVDLETYDLEIMIPEGLILTDLSNFRRGSGDR